MGRDGRSPGEGGGTVGDWGSCREGEKLRADWEKGCAGLDDEGREGEDVVVERVELAV